MKLSPLTRLFRFYLVDRRLAASWLSQARLMMQQGLRGRALFCLKHYREAKALAANALTRWSRALANCAA